MELNLEAHWPSDLTAFHGLVEMEGSKSDARATLSGGAS